MPELLKPEKNVESILKDIDAFKVKSPQGVDYHLKDGNRSYNSDSVYKLGAYDINMKYLIGDKYKPLVIETIMSCDCVSCELCPG